MKKIFMTIMFIVLFMSQNIPAQGWQWVNSGFSEIIFDMSFPPGQSDIGFAVGSTLTSGGDGIVLKTTNGGSTWTKISADTIPGLKAVCFTSVNVGYAGGYQNFLMKTTDGGSTWSAMVVDSKLWFFNNIEFWDANIGIVVSYPSSVYRTSDAGATWGPCFGLKHSVEDICYADATTLFLVGSDERIYKSTNSGFYWTEVDSGLAQHLFLGVEFYNSNYGIVTGENGKVVVTTNGGTNWVSSNAGSSGLLRSVHIINQQNAYVVGTPEQVYKTTNGGINWFSDFSGGNSVALYKIKFTENNTGLICGSDGKFLINTDYVVPVELTSFTATGIGNEVQLNWTTKTELNNSGFEIQRSVDGNEWQKINFISGYGTTSEAQNYSYIDRELEIGNYQYRLKQIDYDGSFDYSDIISVLVSGELNYTLEQNYPNPFNPATTIKFSIPEAANVILNIYNSLGQKVTELVNKNLEAGRYSYNWNAINSASGIYFYELRTEKQVLMKNMILIK
jgi:photosystem II stability/assembly factor-like uncharacterized protein